MSDGLILYHKDILQHARSPKGLGQMKIADLVLQGDSPICGDHMLLYIRLDRDKLIIQFESEACCAVCRASSSMLTAAVSGKTPLEARHIKNKFISMLNTGDASDLANHLPEISVFSKIAQVPSRFECAALAWETLEKSLDELAKSVKPVAVKDNSSSGALVSISS